MRNAKEKQIINKRLNIVRSKEISLERQGGYQNCKKWAISLVKLLAKLALPCTLAIIYLEITSKLTLINSCEFYFSNVLIVHWQRQKRLVFLCT